jgi:hypothetical protein
MWILGFAILIAILGYLVYHFILRDERVEAQLRREHELDEEVVRERVYNFALTAEVLTDINKLRGLSGRSLLSFEEASKIDLYRKGQSIASIIAGSPGGLREFVSSTGDFLCYYEPLNDTSETANSLNMIVDAIKTDMNKSGKIDLL